MEQFSVERGERSSLFASTQAVIEYLAINGVEGVKPDYTPFVGHIGVKVPRRYAAKATRLLFN